MRQPASCPLVHNGGPPRSTDPLPPNRDRNPAASASTPQSCRLYEQRRASLPRGRPRATPQTPFSQLQRRSIEISISTNGGSRAQNSVCLTSLCLVTGRQATGLTFLLLAHNTA